MLSKLSHTIQKTFPITYLIKIKYITLVIWPIASYGYSTGFAPIHVKIKNEIVISQNIIFVIGLNLADKEFFFFEWERCNN